MFTFLSKICQGRQDEDVLISFDGHTLGNSLEQMERITDRTAKHAYCDRAIAVMGTREKQKVHITGQRRKNVGVASGCQILKGRLNS